MMNCKICKSLSEDFHQGEILQKYQVSYFKCTNCGFIQTSEPFWLKEAYENVITQLDIGLVSRNLYLRERIPRILLNCFPEAKNYLDYGGGYGLFVRMMRDEGFNFYRQDLFCGNLFAKYFDISDASVEVFDLVTAFEVFEHLENPLDEISKMFSLADNLIFTTEIPPETAREFSSWWYVSPLTGQHISFYSRKSLSIIAQKYRKHFYSNGRNLHLFSAKSLDEKVVNAALAEPSVSHAQRILNYLNRRADTGKKPDSLLEKDYRYITDQLKRKT